MADLVKFYTWLGSLDWAEYAGVDAEPESIPGWSPPTLGGLLDKAVSDCLEEGEQYLELGTFCGRSLVYALRYNDKQAYVIDPLNLKVADRTSYDFWYETIKKYNLQDRVKGLQCGYEQAELHPNNKFGVILIDGNHDTGHTLAALNKLEPFFADKAIIIVDDYLIYGGDQQITADGSPQEIQVPVKKDVDEWIAKRYREATLVATTPWLNGQAIILFNRANKHV